MRIFAFAMFLLAFLSGFLRAAEYAPVCMRFHASENLVKQLYAYMSENGTLSVLDGENARMELCDDKEAIKSVVRDLGRYLKSNPLQLVVSVDIIEANNGFLKNYGFGGVSYALANQYNIKFLGAGVSQLSYVDIFKGATVDFSDTESTVKVKASPRITLLEGKTGNISQGVELPFSEVNNYGVANTTWKEASLSITVRYTQYNYNDKKIMLNLSVTRDSPNTDKSINKNSIETTFITETNSTILLSGLTLEKETSDEKSFLFIPFFSGSDNSYYSLLVLLRTELQ